MRERKTLSATATVRWIEYTLSLCVSLTLFSRGWLTWRWDSPIRSLFWQEDWWSRPLRTFFDISWAEFAQTSDPYITASIEWIGILLMVLSIVPWLGMYWKFKSIYLLLWPAAILLFIDSFARWVNADYDFGMAIEHSLQMITPLVLLYFARSGALTRGWQMAILVATAFTFIGHGLYAAGIHPVPLSYQMMVEKILGLEQESIMTFLLVFGILDFVAAMALLFSKIRFWVLCYMSAWGLATALARIVANPSNPDPWLFETLVRSSHWMLPLLLAGLICGRKTFSFR